MLETHPFGALHGGTLNLQEWQERYDKVADELKKVDAQELEKAKREVGIEDDDEESEDDEKKEDEEGTKVKKEKEDGVEEEDDEVQNESTPKFKKKKPRQSQLDLSAIQSEQASIDPNLITKLRLTKNTMAMLSDSSTNWNLPSQPCASYSSPPRKQKSLNLCGSLGSRMSMILPRPNRESRRCCI